MSYIAVLAVLCLNLCGQSSPPANLTGDWTGWAYQLGGGDFPLRLYVYLDGDELRAALDLPHKRSTDR